MNPMSRPGLANLTSPQNPSAWQPLSPGPQGSATLASSSGAAGLAGRRLARVDMQSVLHEAADEMAQAFSSRVQDRFVRERRVTTTHSGLIHVPKEARSKLFHQLKSAKTKDHEQNEEGSASDGGIEELARGMLMRPERIRRLAEEVDDDPTAQYLAMLEAADLIESGAVGADPGGVVAAAVREALEEMFAERGDRILADINTVSASEGLAPREAGAFRQAYQELVFGAEGLNATLTHLLRLSHQEGQDANYAAVHARIVTALGLDLAAANPSTDKVRLRALVSDLYHLEVISTVIDRCAELSATLVERHGSPALSPNALAADLVSMTAERWVDADQFKRLADKHGCGEPPEATVDFMAGVRNALRELPVQVFSSSEARRTLLDTAQSALDAAIDREEGIE